MEGYIVPPVTLNNPTSYKEYCNLNGIPYPPTHSYVGPFDVAPTSIVSETHYKPSNAPSAAEGPATKAEITSLLNGFLVNFQKATGGVFGIEGDMSADDSVEPAAAPASTVPRPTELVHDRTFCDACTMPIAGTRYKCNSCDNYDLCESCLPKVFNSASAIHPASHMFTPLAHESVTSRLSSATNGAAMAIPAAQHPASCDFCSQSINGIRYKCLVCSNFDTGSCCASKIAKEHPGHSFVKINKASDYLHVSTPQAVHNRVACDSCNRGIVGTRYKCVHPTCADFDLCEECELSPVKSHNKTHPMLKLTIPMEVDAKVSMDDEERLPSPVPKSIPKPCSGSCCSSSTKAAPVYPQVAHPRVICDICDQKITGPRFKCVHPSCPDFDLCMSCEQGGYHDVAHPLLMLKLPMEVDAQVSIDAAGQQSPKAAFRGRSTVFTKPSSNLALHDASCDICSKDIVGCRLKCLDCSDWDTGDCCKHLLKDQHPGHSFVRINDPKDLLHVLTSNKPRHSRVLCDGCDSSIVGIRYKCMDKSCEDYDLCEACEALPIPVHDRSHPLLKMRVPLQLDTSNVKSYDLVKDHYTQSLIAGFTNLSLSNPSSSAASFSPALTKSSSSQAPTAEGYTLASPAKKDLDFISQFYNREIEIDQEEISKRAEMTQQKKAREESLLMQNLDHGRQEPPVKVLPNLNQGLHATFISDVTVQDGAAFPAGALFVKTWMFQNTGTATWPASTTISYNGGDALSSTSNQLISGEVKPGELVEVSVECKAPEIEGQFLGFWRLKSPDGACFGDRVWIEITVADHNSVSTLSSSSFSLPQPAVLPPSTFQGTSEAAPRSEVATSSLEMFSASGASNVADEDHADIESVFSSDMSDFDEVTGEGAASGTHSPANGDFVLVYDDETSEAGTK